MGKKNPISADIGDETNNRTRSNSTANSAITLKITARDDAGKPYYVVIIINLASPPSPSIMPPLLHSPTHKKKRREIDVKSDGWKRRAEIDSTRYQSSAQSRFFLDDQKRIFNFPATPHGGLKINFKIDFGNLSSLPTQWKTRQQCMNEKLPGQAG